MVIFQWPCGTLVTSRLPRGQRPRSLVILVEVPVSSMKMSLFRIKRLCSRFQLARAVRTFPSSRSCSAACRLFFESDVVALAEPPHRTGANRNAAARAAGHEYFFQRQVRFGGDQLQQPLLVILQRRRAPPSAWRRRFRSFRSAASTGPPNSGLPRNFRRLHAETLRPRWLQSPGHASHGNRASASSPRIRINAARLAHCQNLGNPPDSIPAKHEF